jgi:hypothetical protein
MEVDSEEVGSLQLKVDGVTCLPQLLAKGFSLLSFVCDYDPNGFYYARMER